MDYFLTNYKYVYNLIALTLAVGCCLLYCFSPGCKRLLQKHSLIPISIITIFMIVLLGQRRIEGDTYMYVRTYNLGIYNDSFSLHTEWFWLTLVSFCRFLGLQADQWVLIIEIGYIGANFFVCKKMLNENVFFAMLFFFCSFSFCAYGTNTIRSGLACAFLLLGIAYWLDGGIKGRALFFILSLLSFGCHRTVILPIFCFILANYVIKSLKLSIIVWCSFLLASIVLGNAVMNFLSSFGFDSRMMEYSSSEVLTHYKSGFRWDFILYSVSPIILFWYIAITRKSIDKKYNVLCITYVLSNAVWLLFIRMAYSDRFAYLSWFLIPLVLGYGVIRVPVWKNQDRVAAGVLALQSLFTFGMYFIWGK